MICWKWTLDVDFIFCKFFPTLLALLKDSPCYVVCNWLQHSLNLCVSFLIAFFCQKVINYSLIFLRNDIFIWEGLTCIREHMQTLKMKTCLYYSVIDTWSIILNDNENYKADESPLRLFCPVGSLVIFSKPYNLFSLH